MLHSRFERKLILIAAVLATSAVLAVALSPAARGEMRPLLQSLAIISCSSSSPCQEGSNSSTGPGLEGISAKGNGVVGQTNFNSTSASNGQAGVLGQDLSTSGANDAGVRGTSTRAVGVYGKSTGYLGVFGTGPTYGVAGSSVSGVGVYGLSTTGAANGIGVQGLSTNFVGVNAVGGFFNSTTSDDFPALSIVGNKTGTTFTDLIDACQPGAANPCDGKNSIFSVDGAGDVVARGHISGKGDISASGAIFTNSFFEIVGTGSYFKNAVCVAGCSAATTASAGRAVTTYAPMVSQPTIEDFGEAQLVYGQALVRLDPKFANVVDQRANYLVFITPEGDANTLYVTQKSMGGFTVRESHSGRSTIAFSYRIVAKPFGSSEARLPMVELPKLRSSLLTQAPLFHSHP
jgi:hypothetical protein